MKPQDNLSFPIYEEEQVNRNGDKKYIEDDESETHTHKASKKNKVINYNFYKNFH